MVCKCRNRSGFRAHRQHVDSFETSFCISERRRMLASNAPRLHCFHSQLAYCVQRPHVRAVAVRRHRGALVVSAQQPPGAMLLEEKKELVANSIRGVPDFPKKGILFWDITTLCLDPAAFRCCIEAFTERYKDQKIDVIAGPKLRSYICHKAQAVASSAIHGSSSKE